MFISMIMLCIGMPSCQSDEDLPDSKDYGKAEAPADPTGEFKFYKGDNLKWFFKVLPSYNSEDAVIAINSTTASVYGLGSFYYQKKSETEASVSCFFQTQISVGGNKVGQWNQYEIKLTFLSGHHGTFSGVEKKNPEDKGTEIIGMFVYDSDMELSEILDELNNNEDVIDPSGNEGDPSTIPTLALSVPVVSEITETTARIAGTVLGDIQFKERGFVYALHKHPTINDMKFTRTNQNVISSVVNVSRGCTYFVRMYALIKDKVYYGKEISFTVNGEKLESFKITQIHWSPVCTTLRVERPIEYGEYGVCWGTTPTPTITDYCSDEVKNTGNPNQIDEIHIYKLDPERIYYVRPYHINKTDVEYYGNSIKLLSCSDVISITALYDNFEPYNNSAKIPPIGKFINLRFKINWNNLPSKINKINIYSLVNEFRILNGKSFNFSFYTDVSSGEKIINLGNTELLAHSGNGGEESSGYVHLDITDNLDNSVAYTQYRLYANRSGMIKFDLIETHSNAHR